jgi:hypothetical protein
MEALGTAPFDEIFNFQYARDKNDNKVSENEVYPLLSLTIFIPHAPVSL